MKLEGMTGLMPQLCRDLTPAKPLATGLSIYRTPSDDDPNTWAGRDDGLCLCGALNCQQSRLDLALSCRANMSVDNLRCTSGARGYSAFQHIG